MKNRYLYLWATVGCLGLISCDLERIEDVIPTAAQPVAAFTITNGGCLAPCQVVFTNQSTDAAAFEWNFGDGTPVSNQHNPTHTYEQPGDFIVELTATGPGGGDTETKPLTIGTRTFKKTFGGTGDDEGLSVQQTTDGGYVLFGVTKSEGAGGSDFFLVKTDPTGAQAWKKTFGNTEDDVGMSVRQTSDGGYILLGFALSAGGTQVKLKLLKANSSGNQLWEKIYGVNVSALKACVQQTTDGGYILLGSVLTGPGNPDFYIVKTDQSGNLSWQKIYERPGIQWGSSVQQTSDGGYILSGTGTSGSFDIYLIKTDQTGNPVWEKNIGGTNSESGWWVQQTTDGGYILAGATLSYGAGGYDVYLVKTDNAGNQVWSKTFGGTASESGYAVQQTSDGGFVIVGSTESEGAGSSDFYLIKTDNAGNLTWKKNFGGANEDIGYSVQQARDGGYILLGHTRSFGGGGADFYLIKTDKNGDAQ
jgi:PKD repeat protein